MLPSAARPLPPVSFSPFSFVLAVAVLCACVGGEPGVWARRMVYGVWCMVYGVWCMVYGGEPRLTRVPCRVVATHVIDVMTCVCVCVCVCGRDRRVPSIHVQ